MNRLESLEGLEGLFAKMQASMPKLIEKQKKELQVRKNLADEFIAKKEYAKAFEIFEPLLVSKTGLQGEETADVWMMKLLMANTLSVVDIRRGVQLMPGIFANIKGANPLTLYDECLPQMIEALGCEDPDVFEGIQKRKLLYHLTTILRHEFEFLAAVADGDFDKTVDLIDRGVDVNVVSSEGWSALHMAVHQNRKDLYDLLIKKGVDCIRPSHDGSTVLHIAAAHGKYELVNSLMDHLMGHILFQRRAATINAKNDEGNTALHVAAKSGAPALVTIFLQNSAVHNEQNAAGQTPLQLAQHTEVIKILRNVENVFRVGKNNIKDLPSTLERVAKNFEEWQIYTFCHHLNDGGEPHDIWKLVNESKNRAIIKPKIEEIQERLINDFKKRHRRSK